MQNAGYKHFGFLLAWNSKLAQSDRSSIWPNDIIMWLSWLVFSCISSQFSFFIFFQFFRAIFIAQYSNTWLSFAVAVWQRTSETLHLPQLHLYRSAMRWFMYAIWGYSYVLYVQKQYFLVSVLAQQCSRSIPAKTKYINIVMHITMPIPPRVVMT